MFIAETRTFGFQNVVAFAEKQCWALPQTSPLIRKLRTQGLGLRICGKIIKIYRNSTTSIAGFVSAISKKKYGFTIECMDRFGWMYFESITPYHQVPLL